MTSQVEICNLALAKLGQLPFITSLTEASKSANLFNVFYNPVRDSLIREYLWKFARKRVQLTPLTETPPFDGGNYFQIPTDCLRVVSPGDSYRQQYGRWFVEGDKILADTTTLNLVYLQRVQDPTLFDPIFVQAFAAKLAYEMAMPIAQSQGLKDAMGAEFQRMVVKAAFVGATEQDSEVFLAESFLRAHT